MAAAGFVVAIGALSAVLAAAAARAADDAAWRTLKAEIVGERPVLDGAGVAAIEAPVRPEDPGATPVAVKAAFKDGRSVKGLILVIDENPSPVAAKFSFGPAMREIDLSTRLRVNAYSDVRALVEASDGKLYMASVFVKASGGCSAPALKEPRGAKPTLGDIDIRWTARGKPSASSSWREAQITIHHPNYSGLQMDEAAHAYIPAHFVNRIEAEHGDETLFVLEGGISFSENPGLRFRFLDGGAEALTVTATDTEGGFFEQSFKIERGP